MTDVAPIPISSECPLDPELFIMAYLAGELPAEEATYFEAHFKTCKTCDDLRRELRIRTSLNEFEGELQGEETEEGEAVLKSSTKTNERISESQEDSELSEENADSSEKKPKSTLPVKPQSIKYTIGGRPDQYIPVPPKSVSRRSRLDKVKQFVPGLKSQQKPKKRNRYLQWTIAILISLLPMLIFQLWPSSAEEEKPTRKPAAKAHNFFESQLSGEFRRNPNFTLVRPKLNDVVGPVVEFSWKDNRPKGQRSTLKLQLYTNGEILVASFDDVKPGLIHENSLPSGLYYWTLEDVSQLVLVSKFVVK